MDSILNVLTNYKIADIFIASVGLTGLFIICGRVKALFFDYAMPTQSFMQQLTSLLEQDKVEEAITLCSANSKKPLAYILKAVLERSDRDDHAMEHALDIASSEVAPKLTKGLGHLSMISNVVTLLGLLGTVIGLITAFKAVSFADVSMKQTLLAEGISMAMSATALGLMFAIPIMLAYSVLYARQNKLFSEIDQNSQKVLELLKSRTYAPFKKANAFPNHLNREAMESGGRKPPPLPKAS